MLSHDITAVQHPKILLQQRLCGFKRSSNAANRAGRSGEMLSVQVVIRLHFDKSARSALKLELQALARV